jgi:hypothetical protein
MEMMKQTIEPHHFNQQARQIRARVAAVLRKWGLLPRFKRWRLTQDPDSGMVVLFGILNNNYIATHTSIPFSDYFEPRVLHDLANELQVEVVSCNSDGLRYAFILDRGQLGQLPTHIDYPYIDEGKLLARVVYREAPRSVRVPQAEAAEVDDETLVRQGVGAFLKVFNDIKLRDDAAFLRAAQDPPQVVVIDEQQFKKRVAEYETNPQRRERIGRLFDRPEE